MIKGGECAGFAEDEKRITAYFDERARRFGDDPRALDWSNRAAQEARFRVLSEIGIETGHSVLDVGCGQGDFSLWLREKGLLVDYVGLDLSDRMIALARKKVPCAQFMIGAAHTAAPTVGTFDWVVASGLFYLRRFEPYDYMRCTLTALFAIARLGLAFNTLTDWDGSESADGEFRAKPELIVALCRGLTPFFTLRADYHVGDSTFYLFNQRRG